MEFAINEIKIQAKKLFKSLNSGDASEPRLQNYLKRLALVSLDDLKLKHCLILVSQELGFASWHKAQEVFIGREQLSKSKDFGTLFYPDSCGGFINEWFSEYQQAKSVLMQQPKSKWLLPYKKQFLVVEQSYIKQFNLDDKVQSLWGDVEHDMVKSYNTSAWDELCCDVIKNRKRVY